jgi:hypothetical protein
MRKIKKIITFFDKKKFKHGSMSVILTAAVIAMVIMFNIIAGILLQRFDINFDMSANQMFSIDSQTADFLSRLSDEVTLTVANREGDFAGINEFYNQTNEILRRFAAASDNITLRYIDMLSNPDWAKNYDNLDEVSIVVDSKNTGRHKVLKTEDYFEVSFNEAAAAAEPALLSAILSVTDVSPVHVGIVTGHGENINAQMQIVLEKNAYILHEINLVDAQRDSELDIIIINSPTEDYPQGMLSQIDEWLTNGGLFGKDLIYIAPRDIDTPRIDSFLTDWGIAVDRAFVMQEDPRYTAPMAHLNMNIQFYFPHDFSEDLNPNFQIFGEFLRHTRQLWEEHGNIQTRPILSSFDGALLFPFEEMAMDSQWDSSLVERGAYTVALQSSKSQRFGNVEDMAITSNVTVFGGSLIFREDFLMMGNANNENFFINMMNTLSGKDPDELITITSKSFIVPSFDITEEQARTIAVIFIFGLPALIVTTGIVVWVRRIRQ